MSSDVFRFKQFTIRQDRCAMKVSTDGVVFGAWPRAEGAKRILDIGTGTGLLALMAAQRNSIAHIDAVEIDQDAAEQAAENAMASPWADRVRVHWMDVRRSHVSDPYDLILCNPPYYTGYMEATDARTSLAKHSSELSFTELMQVVDKLLAQEGRFAVIVPVDREKALLGSAEHFGIRTCRRGSLSYIEGRPFKRVLLELWRGDAVDVFDPLIVEHQPGSYTEAYRKLLQPFMLEF